MTKTELLPDDARRAGVQTLVDVLEYRAGRQPLDVVFRSLQGDGVEDGVLTYAELQRQSCAIAARVRELIVPGDRVVILVPPGFEYVAAFFGCLYAGAVAVPAYPPNPRRPDTRVARIVADCGARVALVSDALMARLDGWLVLTPQLRALTFLDVGRLIAGSADGWQDPPVSGSSLAMLQYTSGSTGDPRGVMLAHSNLLHNSAVIHRVSAHRRGDNAVFWLPPFHDMGLIGGIVQPIYANVPTALMAPAAFLQRPFRWLDAMSSSRATTSGAPNFAYDLCVERVTEAERRTLDLSAWRTSFNGAEPIRADTIARFVATFAECGLRSDVILPCYGLAEGTLLVSGGPTQRAPLCVIAERYRLESGELRSAGESDANAVVLVASGEPVHEQDVRIVDPDTGVECPRGQVGEIWVAGGSVATGYWNRPESSAAAFHGQLVGGNADYLRTGDLGVLEQGQLIVTGRLKDLVILDGRNYYPHDLEVAAERSHPSLRNGFTAAFGVTDRGRERLVLVAEVSRHHRPAADSVLFQAIRSELAATAGIVPDEIVLIRQHSIPRTSSGKIRRRACRSSYLDGALDVVGRWQMPGSDVAPARDTLLAFVIDWISVELVVDAAALDAQTSLRNLGLDSLAATRLLVALENHLGRRVDPAQLWMQPDIGSLADFLAGSRDRADTALPRPRPDVGVPTAASTDVSRWSEYLELRARIAALADAGIANPFFREHDGIGGREAIIGGRRVVNFASYNYLGLSGDPVVTRAAQEALARWGSSVSASRITSGERPVHRELEHAIAEFIGADDAIVYIGGHPANVSTITRLVDRDDVVLCDARLHNSGMLGAEYSGARRLVFPHNDWAALDGMLRRVRRQHRRALVLIEGVYSADGDVPDLARFVEVKDRHHAMLMVDEAHSIGVLGATGRGVAEHAGIDPHRIDVLMGTLSKSFASCGGYIAGSRPLVEYLKYTSPGFVFSVGITPADAAAALAALRMLIAEPERVTRLHDRASRFRALCSARGIATGAASVTPVVPVILGSSARVARVSELLLEAGVDAQPMLAPSVTEGQARLRFFIASTHTDADLEYAAGALARAIEMTSREAPRPAATSPA